MIMPQVLQKKAFAGNTTLKKAAIELELLTDVQFEELVRPSKMIHSN